MSTQAGRTVLKGNRRRNKRGLNVDLNTPPVENPEQIGSSTQGATSQAQPVVFPIDVEAVVDDDDVVFATPSAFMEARNKSRRNRARTSVVVDVESEQVNPHASNHKRRRAPVSQTVINCEQYVNLESSDSVCEAVAEEPPTPPPPPPPKEPTFNCPICMGQLVEETSTKCGHIFCKGCIREAIAAQAKCPTCRKKVTKRDLIRVFLPATSV